MKRIDSIVFDMDGTIADLYSVDNWLPKLRAEDASPYRECEPLVPMELLSSIVQEFKDKNIKARVVSWNSMGASAEYAREVRKAKREWLQRYCPILLEDFHVVKYGTPKNNFAKNERAILVDDNAEVLRDWGSAELTIDASETANLISNLLALLNECMNRKAPEKGYDGRTWRVCPLDDRYIISRNGIVKNRQKDTILNPYSNKNGRKSVTIGRTPKTLHRLVAMTWCVPQDCGDPVEYMKGKEVHHINHNPQDNRACNLVVRAKPDHRTEHAILTDYLRMVANTPSFKEFREDELKRRNLME